MKLPKTRYDFQVCHLQNLEQSCPPPPPYFVSVFFFLLFSDSDSSQICQLSLAEEVKISLIHKSCIKEEIAASA